MREDSLDAILYYINFLPITYVTKESYQLGLFYLAQYANDKGFKVKVDNLSSNSPIISKINKTIKETKCHIIGFYVDSENIWVLRKIFPYIKQTNPEIKIIIGGPQITGNPMLVMERLPEVDCGVIGEGEIPFVELLSLQSFSSNLLQSIKGIVYRENSKILINSESNDFVDIEKITIPNRKILSLNGLYNENPKMITGRGCVGSCAFCYEGNTKSKKYLRTVSIEKCLAEFDYLVDEFNEFKYITIVDDNFILNPTRTERFCKELIKKYQGNIKWFCEARVDILEKNLNLLSLMKDAGLIRLQIGGESGSQTVLNAYNKATTVEQIIKVVAHGYQQGIQSIYANFIIGGAFETESTFQETLKLSKDLLHLAPGCMEVGCSIYSPYFGTPMFDNPEKYGITIHDNEMVFSTHGSYPFCSTVELTQSQIHGCFNEYIESIDKTYDELAFSLSYEQRKIHFESFYKYNIISKWYEILSRNKLVSNYFDSIIVGNSKSIRNLSDISLLASYPFRTVNPILLEDNKIGIINENGKIRVSTIYEGALLKLSSGKLSFTDINLIMQEHFPNHSFEQMTEIIKDIFIQFDKEYLTVWNDFS